jgi:glycosyltransferase involved in cell wall biosynthesis
MVAGRTLPFRAGRRGAASADAAQVRVAICSDGEIWGGVERFIVSLAVGLRDAGASPSLILFHDRLLAERLRAAGFNPMVVPARGKYDIRQITRIRTALRDHRTAVLHVHGYRATILGGLASLGTPVRVLRTVHGLGEPLDSWKDFGPHAKLAANHLVERAVARATVAGNVFVSEDVAAISGARRRSSLTAVIKNGLDPAGMTASPSRHKARGFHVGIVGRIVKVKGHQHLVEAMACLRHLPDVHLHVFGAGPLQAQCERQVRENDLTGRVTFHGFCADISARMRALDVLAMPSLHEGLPYTLLEALFLRIPVVASAVGGLQEVITDGKTGLLVPAGDHRALAAALERLYREDWTRRRLGDAGHALVEDQYLASRMTDEYRRLYQTLAQDTPNMEER